MTVQAPTFRRRSGVLWRSVPDGVVVLRPPDDPVAVSGPGRALWEALAHDRTYRQLVDGLSDDFDVDPTQAVAVVDDVLPRLVQLGVVEERP